MDGRSIVIEIVSKAWSDGGLANFGMTLLQNFDKCTRDLDNWNTTHFGRFKYR